MIQYENECVDCGLPCMGDSCSNRNVRRVYCDECGCDAAIYEFEGAELCINCIEEKLTKVE